MSGNRPERGILDTSTVIMLHRLTDATALPAEPLYTANPADVRGIADLEVVAVVAEPA